MLRLELAAPQRARPPPAPAFSASFSSPTLQWPRRKRHDLSRPLSHGSRRKRKGRLATSPSAAADPAPDAADHTSPECCHSPSPSPSPFRASDRKKRAPIRRRAPRNEDGDDDEEEGTANDGSDTAPTRDKGAAIICRKGRLGKPIILALPAAAAAKDGPNGADHLAARSLRPRGAAGARQRRVELWVSLSRDEIEEDYYSITGGRLPRRPKRRPRAVPPSLVDRIFPGSWLPTTVIAEMYKVHEPAESRRVRV